MRSVLYFLFILLVEFFSGFVLAILYWLLSTLVFGEGAFSRSTINELMYYLVILVPPFIYCWMEHKRLKKEGRKKNATVYLTAGVVYLVGSLAYMLILTDFHVLRA